MQSVIDQVSAVLLRALEAHHAHLGHSLEQVSSRAASVALTLGLSEADVAEIQHASLLHDVGKVGLPPAILQKPGRLDESELQQMRRHTVNGQRILDAAPAPALAAVGRLVRSSHEHEHGDGSGYPDRLAGCEIPPLPACHVP